MLDPTARDGEIIRLRNRTRALEAHNAELTARLEQAKEQLRLANIDATNTTAELAKAEAERDALKAADERFGGNA